MGLLAAAMIAASALVGSAQEPSLVARLQQFIKDNPRSPQLESIYSSLLAAAARDGDAAVLLTTAD
jgi:hypothetical protein